MHSRSRKGGIRQPRVEDDDGSLKNGENWEKEEETAAHDVQERTRRTKTGVQDPREVHEVEAIYDFFGRLVKSEW